MTRRSGVVSDNISRRVVLLKVRPRLVLNVNFDRQLLSPLSGTVPLNLLVVRSTGPYGPTFTPV